MMIRIYTSQHTWNSKIIIAISLGIVQVGANNPQSGVCAEIRCL